MRQVHAGIQGLYLRSLFSADTMCPLFILLPWLAPQIGGLGSGPHVCKWGTVLQPGTFASQPGCCCGCAGVTASISNRLAQFYDVCTAQTPIIFGACIRCLQLAFKERSLRKTTWHCGWHQIATVVTCDSNKCPHTSSHTCMVTCTSRLCLLVDSTMLPTPSRTIVHEPALLAHG